MSKIDVVIPMFNAEKYIGRALDSLIAQTLTPNKVIVVDDGSTDSSLEIVKKYQSKMPNLLVLPGAHKGVNAARNTGILASSGSYIAFLDCDDYWSREKLQNQMNHFKEHPNCVAVFSNCFINDEINHSEYKAVVNRTHKFSHMNIITQRFRVIGSASSISIARPALDDVGLFDESLDYGEDYEQWVRLSRDFEICEISNVDVYISKRENSVQTSEKVGMSRFRNATAYLNVWIKYPEALKSERRELERLIFPDLAKALLAAPRDLLVFHRVIKGKYQEIHQSLFSNKTQVSFFYIRNFARTLTVTFRSLLRKNLS